MKFRTLAVSLAAVAMALAGAPAVAQGAYPARAVSLVVSQAAGGTNDIVGRLMGQKLGEVMNASVVVDNRPGAGGNIGTQLVAKAPKDGYTLLMTVRSIHAISPSFPAQDLIGFLTAARREDAGYPYASAIGGTLEHLRRASSRRPARPSTEPVSTVIT